MFGRCQERCPYLRRVKPAGHNLQAYWENRLKQRSPDIARPVHIPMEVHGRVLQNDQKHSAIDPPEEMICEC